MNGSSPTQVVCHAASRRFSTSGRFVVSIRCSARVFESLFHEWNPAAQSQSTPLKICSRSRRSIVRIARSRRLPVSCRFKSCHLLDSRELESSGRAVSLSFNIPLLPEKCKFRADHPIGQETPHPIFFQEEAGKTFTENSINYTVFDIAKKIILRYNLKTKTRRYQSGKERLFDHEHKKDHSSGPRLAF